jgi:hypothetical protein
MTFLRAAVRTTALSILLGAAPGTLAAEASGSDVDVSSNSVTRAWEDWRASGVWRTDYYHSSKSLDDATGFLGSTAQIKVLPTFTESLDGKVEARATNSALGEGDTQTRLVEGYVTAHFTSADLQIGRQIIAWGRADGINPTDNVSPRDFTGMLPFEDDQRFGTIALKLDLYLSQEHTLSVLAAPFFEPSEVPLPPTLTIFERMPARTPSNTQAGMKLNKIGEGSDWSISYYRGFSLVPTARVLCNDVRGSAVELHYDRINAFGADFARNYGRFGLRGEAAYVDTSDDTGEDPGTRNPYLFWIVGVDRTFYEYLNVNLQFFQRRARRHQDPQMIADPLARSTARINAMTEGQPERISNGISFRVSHQWFNETLKAEVFAAINLTGGDSFVRPLVTYAFSDRWKGTIGAELYSGGADTQYGSLESNRGAFVELRYGF